MDKYDEVSVARNLMFDLRCCYNERKKKDVNRTFFYTINCGKKKRERKKNSYLF
jgi:hypothetical protein